MPTNGGPVPAVDAKSTIIYFLLVLVGYGCSYSSIMIRFSCGFSQDLHWDTHFIHKSQLIFRQSYADIRCQGVRIIVHYFSTPFL